MPVSIVNLPAPVLTDILLLTVAPHFDNKTRDLARFAPLCHAFAEPAREASLFAVEPGAALSRELARDLSISRWFRTIILHPPGRLRSLASEASMAAHDAVVRHWRRQVAVVLDNVGGARHLVFDGDPAALDLATIETLHQGAWPTVTLRIRDPLHPELREDSLVPALFLALSPSARSLTITNFHSFRRPKIELPAAQWTQLRRLTVHKVDRDILTEIVAGAHRLEAIDTDDLVGAGFVSDERSWREVVVHLKEEAPYPGMSSVAKTGALEGLTLLECVFVDHLMPSLIMDGVPLGLHTLRLRLACLDHLVLCAGLLFLALHPSRWPDARLPRVVEIVYTAYRRGDNDYDPFAPVRRCMKFNLLPLRESCAARGVHFDIIFNGLG